MTTSTMTVNEDQNDMAEKILDFTLKIMYLLTGEGYAIVKKTSGEYATSSRHHHVSEEHRGTQDHITDPSTWSPSPLCEKKKKKVLEMIKKMMELLTGEVPIRCQDVTVYFSMEEWEYLEGHKDLYKDVMMEDWPPLTSPDGSRKRNPPETCPRPLDSRDSTQEDLTIPHQDQHKEETFITVKVKEEEEETSLMEYQQTMEEEIGKMVKIKEEEPFLNINTDGSRKRNPPETCPRPLESQDSTQEDLTIPHQDQHKEQTFITVKVKEEKVETSLMEYQQTMEEEIGMMVKIKQEEPSLDINTDGSRKRNPPETCPHPLDSQDLTQEDLTVPHQDQSEELKDIKAEVKEEEEMMENGHYQSIENDPPTDPTILKESSMSQEGDHKGETSLSCLECGEYFKMESELLLHLQTYNHVTFKCPECGKCFSDKTNLLKHQNTHTSGQPVSYQEHGNGFTKKVNLLSQQSIHTRKHPFSCSECDKSYADKGKLCRHQKIHTGERPYSCFVCGKSFSRKGHCITHQRIHMGERPFSCSECGKGFFDKRKLISHHRIHTGERPFSCSECDKSYTDKRNLLRHQKIHTGDNLFLCSECGKNFTERAHFIRHQRTHTGERPYSCLECGKCFTLKGHYFRHQKIHTGERPYSCLECGKSFIQKEHFFRHQRIHTGEHPHSCSVCRKGFYDNRSLLMHQRVHTGERPFSCSECGKSYTEKRNLLRHQKTHR